MWAVGRMLMTFDTYYFLAVNCARALHMTIGGARGLLAQRRRDSMMPTGADCLGRCRARAASKIISCKNRRRCDIARAALATPCLAGDRGLATGTRQRADVDFSAPPRFNNTMARGHGGAARTTNFKISLYFPA